MKKKIITSLSVAFLTALLFQFNGGLNLNFQKTSYALGDLNLDWEVPAGDPIFNVSEMIPGDSQERVVDVTNTAPSIRPIGVRGIKTEETGNLSSVLTIEIKKAAETIYGPNSLANFFTDSSGPSGIPLSNLAPGETNSYTFKITFNSDAGVEFAGQTLMFDLTIGLSFDVPEECQQRAENWNPIFGTSGNDEIKGTKLNDIIFGFEGNDHLQGMEGRDCILGGPGEDNINGNDKDDVLFGEGDNDRVDGNDGNDTGFGGEGDDIMIGRNGNDSLFGELGTDRANGNNGVDSCDAEFITNCEP